MQLGADQLGISLARGLASVYLVTGDEPLQHAEAADAIRTAARDAGHTAREVLEAGPDFDWSRLALAADSLSLFADRRLVDLRLPTGHPGRDGGAALAAWADRPPDDAVLLVTAPRLESRARSSGWYRALDVAGVVVSVGPVEPARLPRWLEARMRTRGLEPTREAVGLLAARVEGNLLAAAQEVDKLLLLGGPGPVDVDHVAEVVTDAARWSPFDLGDAVLAGEPERAVRIAAGLRAEGTAAPVIVWALQRELARVADVAARVAQGMPSAQAIGAAGVWRRRRRAFETALRRFPALEWQALAGRAARLERLAKGAARGSFWDELIELTTIAAGARTVPMAPRRAVVVQR